MHHRCLDFEITKAHHEFAHGLDNFGARNEGIAHFRIDHQIDVAHTVALFGIGEAMKFFW